MFGGLEGFFNPFGGGSSMLAVMVDMVFRHEEHTARLPTKVVVWAEYDHAANTTRKQMMWHSQVEIMNCSMERPNPTTCVSANIELAVQAACMELYMYIENGTIVDSKLKSGAFIGWKLADKPEEEEPDAAFSECDEQPCENCRECPDWKERK